MTQENTTTPAGETNVVELSALKDMSVTELTKIAKTPTGSGGPFRSDRRPN